LKQNPQEVFLLGELVRKSFEQNLKISIKKPNHFEYFGNKYQKITLIAIQHPSYIAVYKKKQKDIFIQKISEQIHKNDNKI
jgi:uracil-DNA glycosylase